MKTCLFVIDVQKGFISGNTSFIIPRLTALLNTNRFDYTIFTTFHNLPDSPHRRLLNWDGLIDPEECELASEIKPFAKHVIKKDVYTAVNRQTMEFIEKNNVSGVSLAGMDTDCCILKTAVDFFEAGIPVSVLEYYCASNGGIDSHKSAIAVLNRLIGMKNILYGDAPAV